MSTEKKEDQDGDIAPIQIASEFDSMGEFNSGIHNAGYARYNYPALIEREQKMVTMIEGAKDAALFNAGTAAMHTVLQSVGLHAGDTVLCANAIYGTTTDDVSALRDLGVKVVFFDAGDMPGLQELVTRLHPRLIVAESVTNAKKMEVLDLSKLREISAQAYATYQELTPESILEKLSTARVSIQGISPETKAMLLETVEEYKTGSNPFVFRELVREMEQELGLSRKETVRELSRLVNGIMRAARKDLTIIIDNTLPSPALLNPVSALKNSGAQTVVVESGTKHYQEGANEITMGIAYSDNTALMRRIKERRIEMGTYLQPSDERKIPNSIEQTMPAIMKRHARNALLLAKFLQSLPRFDVSHPNLEKHAQHDLAMEIAPEGLVSIFYVTLPDDVTGEAFMQKVKDVAGDRVGLGSSFGHLKTWLSNYGMDSRTIRIAAGSETEADFDKIIAIFKKAVIDLGDEYARHVLDTE